MSASLQAPRPAGHIQFWNTRAAVLIAAIILFFAVVILCAPTAWMVEWAVLLTDGLLAATWTAAACALGAFLLRRTEIRASPLLFLATSGGLGLGIFSLLGLGLGLVGWLNRGTALAMPVASIILLVVDLLGSRRDVVIDLKGWLRGRAGMSWLWLVPVVSLAIVAVAASVMPGQLWKPLDPHPYDVVSYHLQVPREWYEAQRIVPLLHNVFSFFPFNVEIQFLLLMHVMGGPLNAMYACQFMSLFFTVLMVIAVAGAISQDGEPVIGAAIASVVPWVMMLAGVGYVESGLLLYTTLAIAWTLVPGRDAGRAEMALAGMMAGFACGAKITAVPMVLLAIPVALFITSILHRRPKITSIIAACGVFLAAGLLVFSPWLLRNLFWSGNPIFPVAMNSLGHAHFTLDQVERFRVAHSPTPTQQALTARLWIVWNDVIAHWQYGYVLLPLGLLGALLRWRDRQTWMLLITGAIMFIVWIGFTHLLPRFLVTLVPIAAILAGNLRWGRLRPIGIAWVLIAGAFGWTGVFLALTKITRDPDRSVLIGVRGDLSFLIPAALGDAKNSDKQVGLVGDAEAFLYQIPMTRLHYRTVFDVSSDIDDPASAWAGPQAKGDPNWLLVINPAEIERLHRTYWKIPALPPAWQQQGDQPFVLRGDQVDK
jgi:hypothetical protein